MIQSLLCWQLLSLQFTCDKVGEICCGLISLSQLRWCRKNCGSRLWSLEDLVVYRMGRRPLWWSRGSCGLQNDRHFSLLVGQFFSLPPAMCLMFCFAEVPCWRSGLTKNDGLRELRRIVWIWEYSCLPLIKGYLFLASDLKENLICVLGEPRKVHQKFGLRTFMW